jgi:hypothetical protein
MVYGLWLGVNRKISFIIKVQGGIYKNCCLSTNNAKSQRLNKFINQPLHTAKR